MYHIICIFFCSLILSFGICAKTSLTEVSNEFSMYLNSLSGSGASSSAYDKGIKFQDILTVYGEGKLKDNSYTYNYSLLGTNDKSVDQKSFIFNSISAQFKNNKRVITVGDIFDSYSQYSLSSALKGFSYKTSSHNKNTSYLISAGFVSSRWDSFYGNDDIRPMTRKVVGMRASSFKVNRNLKMSINAIIVRDGDKKSKNETKYATQLLSTDWKYHPIKGLDITGESAIANGKLELSNGGDVSKTGMAHKLRMVGDGQGLRGVIEIEQVGSDFENPVGGAVKDRLKYKTSWRYKKNKLMWYQFGLMWFRNNLSGQLGSTTESLRPSFKISKKRVFKRRYSKASFNYNLTRRRNSASEQKNQFVAFGYSDRFKKKYKFNSNIGYNIFKTQKNITDQKQFMFDFGVSTRKSFEKYSIKPFFKFARWTTEDDLSFSTDKSTNYSLGSSISLFKYDLDATISLGKYGLNREKGDNSDREFIAIDANYAPKFLEKYWNSTMICSISYNKYKFTDSSQDFKETRILVGINSRL